MHESVNFVHDPEKQYRSLSEWSATGVAAGEEDAASPSPVCENGLAGQQQCLWGECERGRCQFGGAAANGC